MGSFESGLLCWGGAHCAACDKLRLGQGLPPVFLAATDVGGPGDNTPDNWLFGISPEGIGVVGMMINFAVSIGVSLITPPPSSRIQDLVMRIRTPAA